MIESAPGGAVLRLRVIPRASQTRVDGVRNDALLIRLRSSPVDGAANDELIELLAARLGVPRRGLSIIGGETSRHKRVFVSGLTPGDVTRLLGLP